MSKSFTAAVVKAVEDETAPNGAFEAVLSTASLDRDGEYVDAHAFDPLPEHITIDVDHGLSTQTTVGSGVPFYDGDVLKVKGTFSSIARAQEVRTLVREGHIRTLSIAFRSHERQVKDGYPHVVRGELLNAAFVAIPANPEALVLSAKAGARHSTADLERMQAIHDVAVELGVTCSTKAAHTVSTLTKTIAGSYEAQAQALYAAVSELAESGYARVLATFPDRVIYETYEGDGYAKYESAYTVNDEGAYTLEAPKRVEVEEIVVDAEEPATDAGKSLGVLALWRARAEALAD